MGKTKYACPDCSSLLIKQSDIFEFLSVGASTKKRKRRLHICSSCSYQTFTPTHASCIPFQLVDDFVLVERFLDPAEKLDGSFCQLYDAYFAPVRQNVRQVLDKTLDKC
jgi:hypothetical protein